MQIIILVSALAASWAQAETSVELAPIIKTSTPGDVLLEDAIVPPWEGKAKLNSATGSIQNAVQNQIAIPVGDYGAPGNLAQIRGFGLSSEDVAVQTLGISLNPVQGGGYDLSAFPQYLWSSYRYQSGPALSSINPTASTGTFSLVPWTADVLTQPGSKARATGFYSGLGVSQLSAAAKDSGNVAVAAGYSSGQMVGPSGSFSGRWSIGRYTGSAHVLATSVDSEVKGPVSYPSPHAHSLSQRIIPILQSDFQIGNDSLIKSSIFYDRAFLKYEDPDGGFDYPTYTQQWGAENALLMGPWKLGANTRIANYHTNWIEAPQQVIGNLQISRLIEIQSFTFEPTLQGNWITGYGLLPQGSLGARYEWDEKHQATFSRLTFSRRFPSLIDRYGLFNFPGGPPFVGNPNLEVETDWTGILGWEHHGKLTETTLQTYAQLRKNPRVSLPTTVTNLDDAYIVAVTGMERLHLSHSIDVFETLSVSHSRLIAAGSEFPYVPLLNNVLGVSVHSKPHSWGWDWSTSTRWVSSRVSNYQTRARLPGYGVVDTSYEQGLGKGLSIAGRMENLFDRTIEYFPDYPTGRTFSILLTGEI